MEKSDKRNKISDDRKGSIPSRLQICEKNEFPSILLWLYLLWVRSSCVFLALIEKRKLSITHNTEHIQKVSIHFLASYTFLISSVIDDMYHVSPSISKFFFFWLSLALERKRRKKNDSFKLRKICYRRDSLRVL